MTLSERARALIPKAWASGLDHWLARHRRLSCVVDVGRHMARDSKDDRVTGLAAEVAFFALLSVFPGLLTVAAGLGALDSLFGSELVARAQREVITVSATFLTDRAQGTAEAIEALFERGSGGVFTFGVVAALWAASRGMSTVLRTLAKIYDVEETRSRIRTRFVALGLAVGTMLLVVLTLTSLVVGPLFGAGATVARWVGLQVVYGAAWEWLGVPVAFLALLAWAAVVFHSAPHRRPCWRQHVGGAALTAVLWVVVSVGFRLYLQLFGGNPVFGVLGGALVVLLWMYVLSLALLVGAELNAVLTERSSRVRQRSRDRAPGADVLTGAVPVHPPQDADREAGKDENEGAEAIDAGTP